MGTATPPIEETWDLTQLFPDDAAFREAAARLRRAAAELERFRGQCAASASNLALALDEVAAAWREFGRLRCYASLRADRAVRDPDGQALQQEVERLVTDLTGTTAFVRPEILSVDPERLEAFLADEPRLAPHAHFLRDLLRQRTHVLGPAEERVLAEASLFSRDAQALFQVLHSAELPRPDVTLESGERFALTPVNFHRHRGAHERADRRAIFPAYFGAYARLRDTLAHNLHSAVKAHLFRARVRGYDSCLEAALHPDNVPAAVYRNLIAQVRRNLPLLQRYFALRRRALGIACLEYSDLHCALGGAPRRHWSAGAAMAAVASATEPLGPEYVATLHRAFGERWVDWHPGVDKRAGAYSTGWAYDVHPFVLLNFVGDHESASTLAHEMGHALHSHFSNRAQPFPSADYSIFVAEVASTLNEALLSAHLLRATTRRDERIALLASELDALRGTLFRQTQFAEFELAIHERVERGEALTGQVLDRTYLDMLREYYGHADGACHVADTYAVEWAAIPHLYYDFYVYQYATGIVAAQALAHALLRGAPGARERYLEFLAAGGSDYPLALLRRAGVDLETAEPYEAAFGRMAARLDELEALLG